MHSVSKGDLLYRQAANGRIRMYVIISVSDNGKFCSSLSISEYNNSCVYYDMILAEFSSNYTKCAIDNADKA